MNVSVRRSVAPLAAAFALLATPGCVTKPTVMLDHADIRSASLGGLGIQVFLKVTNPNVFDVQARNVNVTVTIGRGFKLRPIVLSPNSWLPSQQTTVLTVPVVIPWEIVPGVIAESLGSPSVRYHIEGTVDVTAVRALDIQKDNYPVSEDGSVPRQMMIDTARSVIPL